MGLEEDAAHLGALYAHVGGDVRVGAEQAVASVVRIGGCRMREVAQLDATWHLRQQLATASRRLTSSSRRMHNARRDADADAVVKAVVVADAAATYNVAQVVDGDALERRITGRGGFW